MCVMPLLYIIFCQSKLKVVIAYLPFKPTRDKFVCLFSFSIQFDFLSCCHFYIIWINIIKPDVLWCAGKYDHSWTSVASTCKLWRYSMYIVNSEELLKPTTYTNQVLSHKCTHCHTTSHIVTLNSHIVTLHSHTTKSGLLLITVIL